MSVFLTSVSSVVEIVLIMALGYILRRNNWFADSFFGGQYCVVNYENCLTSIHFHECHEVSN